jgi:hypothetical protein
MEVCYQRIFKIFKGDDPIADINDQYWQLRVEEIPEEDELLGPGDRIINVHHFKVEPPSTVHMVRKTPPLPSPIDSPASVSHPRPGSSSRL